MKTCSFSPHFKILHCTTGTKCQIWYVCVKSSMSYIYFSDCRQAQRSHDFVEEEPPGDPWSSAQTRASCGAEILNLSDHIHLWWPFGFSSFADRTSEEDQQLQTFSRISWIFLTARAHISNYLINKFCGIFFVKKG